MKRITILLTALIVAVTANAEYYHKRILYTDYSYVGISPEQIATTLDCDFAYVCGKHSTSDIAIEWIAYGTHKENRYFVYKFYGLDEIYYYDICKISKILFATMLYLKDGTIITIGETTKSGGLIDLIVYDIKGNNKTIEARGVIVETYEKE